MKRSFLAGFLACYALAGVAASLNALEIPATTPAGAIFAGVMWAPLNLLPEDIAVAMVPSWAFDFNGGSK